MARPKSNDRKLSKNLSLPEALVARMELELYSDVEGRIPVGAQGDLIAKVMTRYFHKLDKQRARLAAESALLNGEGEAPDGC